jgi:hypothetical protein
MWHAWERKEIQGYCGKPEGKNHSEGVAIGGRIKLSRNRMAGGDRFDMA